MKQSRAMSIFETVGGTALGFAISWLVQSLVVWWFNLPLSHADNLGIIGIFTIASLIRGYGWRRLMEAMHVRRPLSPFMQAVIAERFRQIEIEGYDSQHDDGHGDSELAAGSAAYMLGNRNYWPWRDGYRNDHPQRRKYVIGGAMALAAGEHLDRNRKRKADTRIHVGMARP